MFNVRVLTNKVRPSIVPIVNVSIGGRSNCQRWYAVNNVPHPYRRYGKVSGSDVESFLNIAFRYFELWLSKNKNSMHCLHDRMYRYPLLKNERNIQTAWSLHALTGNWTRLLGHPMICKYQNQILHSEYVGLVKVFPWQGQRTDTAALQNMSLSLNSF